MFLLFGLNKWEMMNNGSGWVHFLAFAGFFYHYIVWERIWTGQEKKGDHVKMLLLPWIITLGIAGPYCAVYSGVLLLGYGFCMVVTWRRTNKWDRRYPLYGVCAVLPLLIYMWSTSHVSTGLSSDGSSWFFCPVFYKVSVFYHHRRGDGGRGFCHQHTLYGSGAAGRSSVSAGFVVSVPL